MTMLRLDLFYLTIVGFVEGSQYNAVKMKDRIEDILGKFVSDDTGESHNAHVLEQFWYGFFDGCRDCCAGEGC